MKQKVHCFLVPETAACFSTLQQSVIIHNFQILGGTPCLSTPQEFRQLTPQWQRGCQKRSLAARPLKVIEPAFICVIIHRPHISAIYGHCGEEDAALNQKH